MTKKKRELIEILLDNVKPEDWPENAEYAAQDDHSGKIHAYFEPMHSNVWVSGRSRHYLALAELCKHRNKTIVHREEFMKRWNERNQSVDSEGWIQWNGGEMPSVPVRKSPLETQIGGDHYTKLAIQPMRYSMKKRTRSIAAYDYQVCDQIP